MRVTDALRARWRTFAAELGVSVADMVRAAVAFAEASMPRDWIAKQRDQERDQEQEQLAADVRRVLEGGDPR